MCTHNANSVGSNPARFTAKILSARWATGGTLQNSATRKNLETMCPISTTINVDYAMQFEFGCAFPVRIPLRKT